MPRGYRFFVVALGVLSLSAASPPPKNDRQQPKDASGDQIAPALANIASALNEANKASNLEKPCSQGGNDRSSDLCAQWKAADAAEFGANGGWLFGTIGSLIGALTLAAAWSAAKWARRAAEETKRAADVAEAATAGADAAILIASKTAEAAAASANAAIMSIRPWIEVKLLKVDTFNINSGSRLQSIISFSLFNHGNSPATELGSVFVLEPVKQINNGEAIAEAAVRRADEVDEERRKYGSIIFPKFGWPIATSGIGFDHEALDLDETFYWLGGGAVRYRYADEMAQLKFRFAITAANNTPISVNQLCLVEPELWFFKVWLDK